MTGHGEGLSAPAAHRVTRSVWAVLYVSPCDNRKNHKLRQFQLNLPIQ